MNRNHDPKTGQFTSKKGGSSKAAASANWDVVTYNNGHPTYSLTERDPVTKKTRMVNPKNGRVLKR